MAEVAGESGLWWTRGIGRKGAVAPMV